MPIVSHKSEFEVLITTPLIIFLLFAALIVNKAEVPAAAALLRGDNQASKGLLCASSASVNRKLCHQTKIASSVEHGSKG